MNEARPKDIGLIRRAGCNGVSVDSLRVINGEGRLKKVLPAHLQKIHGIVSTPCLFQEQVPKKANMSDYSRRLHIFRTD